MNKNEASTPNRKLAAIFFADIQGYTAVMQDDEKNGMNLLRRYQAVLKKEVTEYNGEVLKNYGDGSLCLFSSVLDAIHCAINIQNTLQQYPVIPLRIGIHLGDVVFEGNDIYGDALNITSRIESMGIAGSVLISRNIYEKVRNQADLNFESLGFYEFKNVLEPMEIFALHGIHIKVPQRKTIQGKFKKRKKSKNKWLWFGLVLIALLGLLYATYNDLFQGELFTKSEVNPLESKKIAIIPLLNLNSKDDNLEYFSDGVTNEIIDELAQIKSLTITAFTSSMMYKGSSKTHSEIAKELEVNYLITGTSRIFSFGDSVKLSLELIDPKANNKRVWNATYTERMENAPNIQMAIAKQVSTSLNLKLSPEEIALLDTPNTTSGEAFRLFLLARAEFMKLNRDGFSNSINSAKKALELDPNYAQANTFLAWAYQLSSNPWFDGHFNIPVSELNDLVTPLIEKSMALDPSSSDVYLVRGHQRVFIDALLRDGKKDVEYGLKINSWPLVPTTYCICVVISTYVALDELSRANDLITLTRKVDPGSVFIAWDAANLLTKEGKYTQAQHLYEEAARIAPVSMFNSFLGWNYYHSGAYKKALLQLEKTYEESELPIALNVAYLSNTYFKTGETEKADQYLKELLNRDKEGELHLNLYISIVYAERGERELAMQYLEKAMASRNWGIAFLTNLDPVFKPFYDHPTFQKIRKRMQYYQ